MSGAARYFAGLVARLLRWVVAPSAERLAELERDRQKKARAEAQKILDRRN